nr:hypothetical protein BaRGS_017491 [Batillaria attramentaria]
MSTLQPKAPVFRSTAIHITSYVSNSVMILKCRMAPDNVIVTTSSPPALLVALPDGYIAGDYSCAAEGIAMSCLPEEAASSMSASKRVDYHPPYLVGRKKARVNCTIMLNQFFAIELASKHPLEWAINGRSEVIDDGATLVPPIVTWTDSTNRDLSNMVESSSSVYRKKDGRTGTPFRDDKESASLVSKQFSFTVGDSQKTEGGEAKDGVEFYRVTSLLFYCPPDERQAVELQCRAQHPVLDSGIVTATKIVLIAVLLYGCETWRTTKTMQQKIQTFLNTCLRRIFNIRWPEKIRNEELWERAGQEPVAKQILRRKRKD